MRFWDSSAISPLLLPEDTTPEMVSMYRADVDLVVWWGTIVECESALSRREREGIGLAASREGRLALATMAEAWDEVPPSSGIRDAAVRLLRSHALRAADALQLAAALHAAGGVPPRLGFVSLDRRLRTAAAREGFPVFGGAPGDP